jgi:hypothetical protein
MNKTQKMNAGSSEGQDSRENVMMSVRNIDNCEYREVVTKAILEMLTDLPEIQRKIFVWNHYCGYRPKQIAELLGCSPSEIEGTLVVTNSRLYQRARILLEEDPPRNSSSKSTATCLPMVPITKTLSSSQLFSSISRTS